MLYYLGKGTEFKKEDCKEYKTIEGAIESSSKGREVLLCGMKTETSSAHSRTMFRRSIADKSDGSVNIR